MSESFLSAAAARVSDADRPADERALTAALDDVSTGLELHGTSLTTLPSGISLAFERPRDVDLCGNRLVTLPDDLLSPGAPLKKLSLCRNQLTHLPPCVAKVRCPKAFLQHNALTQLDNLPRDDSVTTAAGETVASGGLAILDASNNALDGSLELRDLPTLQKLRLRENMLSALHLADVPMLSAVELSANALTEVPSGLIVSERYDVLRTLVLGGNRLTAVPDTLACCANLVELDLSANQIGALPAALGDLTNLKKLWVQVRFVRRFVRSVRSADASVTLAPLSAARPSSP